MRGWDKNPTEVEIGDGYLIKVFYRGALAKALNRKVVTIRQMERNGIICTPALQGPPDRAGRPGRWLYTHAQIQALIELATVEGVINPNKHRRYTQRFIDEAHRILSERPRVVAR